MPERDPYSLPFERPSKGDEMSFNIGNAMGGVTQQIQGSVKQQEEAKAASSVQAKYDSKKDETTISGPAPVIAGLQEELKAYQQVKASWKKMVDQNQLQQDRLKAHPFTNTLAQIAAGLAQTDPNPTTRGLGIAAGKINPSLDELQKQAQPLLKGQADATGDAVQTLSRMAAEQRSGEEMALAKTREGRLDKQFTQSEADRAELRKTNKENQLRDDARAFDSKWDDRVQKGLFDKGSYISEYKKQFPDAKPEEIADAVKGKEALKGAADKLRKEVGKEQMDAWRQKTAATQAFARSQQAARIDGQLNAVREKVRSSPAAQKLTQQQVKNVEEIETTRVLVGNLQNDLQSHPELFGPWWQDPAAVARRYFDPIFDEAASQVKANYDHALPIMVQLLKEGTRGYSKAQSAWVLEKVPKLTDSIERTQGKINFLTSFLQAREKGEDKAFLAAQMASQGKSPYPGASGTPAPAAKPEAASPKRNKVSLDEINKTAGGN